MNKKDEEHNFKRLQERLRINDSDAVGDALLWLIENIGKLQARIDNLDHLTLPMVPLGPGMGDTRIDIDLKINKNKLQKIVDAIIDESKKNAHPCEEKQ